MQRPGAAERDEGEVARIVATLHRDEPKRTQHLGVDDLDHRSRVEVAERVLGRGAIELETARERVRKAAERRGSRP